MEYSVLFIHSSQWHHFRFLDTPTLANSDRDVIGRLRDIELTNLDFSQFRKFAFSHFFIFANKPINSHISMPTSMSKQGPILKKSRSGCRDCRRRKVKVSGCTLLIYRSLLTPLVR